MIIPIRRNGPSGRMPPTGPGNADGNGAGPRDDRLEAFMTTPPGSGTATADDLGLRGTAIIVTGASSGIGAATAARLGAAGAGVVLVGRRAEPLAAQAEIVTAAGGQAVCVAADM